MTNLALKSVLHGWPRYLPVAIAVGVSGLMMVVQVALAMGAFSLAAAPVRLSQADLWVGPADAAGLDQSRGLSQMAAARLWMEPRITRIETYHPPGYTSLGEDDESGSMALLSGLDTAQGAAVYARALTPDARALLAEPGTAAIDQTDARRLGIGPGDTLYLGGRALRVVALAEGARALFGVQVLASDATRRELAPEGSAPAFYALTLRPGADAQAVTQALSEGSPAPEYRVWLPEELATATVRAWALGSGAGTLFLASSAIALVITLMVVSQTLGAAVAGSIREYAALRAYGIGFRAVQWLVMKQGFYVSLAALVLTGAASVLVLGLLRLRGVATELPPMLAAGVGLALMATVGLSNLMAVRRLRRADPAALLR